MSFFDRWRYIVIAGPTASGKTHLANTLAQAIGGELINFDSVQVYRGFDIGSAKDKNPPVPMHLIDVCDPHEEFNAAVFASHATKHIDDVRNRNRVPILVGGTGLYLRALWGDGFDDLPTDPGLRTELDSHSTEQLGAKLKQVNYSRWQQIHPNDRVRLLRAVELSELGVKSPSLGHDHSRREEISEAYIVVLDPPRALLHDRIAVRSHKMLKDGLLAEVTQLLARGVDPDCKPMQSIGYKQASAFLKGEIEESDLYEGICTATRRYAKRQCTWFRKVPANVRIQKPVTEEIQDPIEFIK